MIAKQAQPLSFLNGGGEMGELVRSMDWSRTPIGTPENWPQCLRTSVSILLNSQFPMFIWWGENLTTIYNDAYLPIAGEKHPDLLGRSGRDGWSEIWNDLSPMVEKVFGGTSTWSEDQVLYINRQGYIEEAYFTFSYSPILDEEGEVAGLFCACIETTEKVVAKKKMEESERNLRNTILQSPVAMCILKGSSFVLEIANDRMFELWGRSADELMHKPIFDGLPESRNQGLEELLDKVYATGETFQASEHPVQFPRNNAIETVYANFVYQPFRESDGTISGIIAVAIDVTEQVLARKKVEESEVRLQAVINATPECIKIVAHDGTLQYMNKAGLQMVEADESQVSSACVYDVIAPEYRSLWMQYHKRVCEGESLSWEFDIIGLKGNRRRMETHAVPLPGNHGVSQLAVSRDVTERKRAEEARRQSEERLQKVLSIETVGVIYFDLEGTIHDANAAFERMSGYGSEVLVSGRLKWDQITPMEFKEVAQKSKEEFLAKGQNTPYEKQVIRPDGSRWWGLFSGKRLSEAECVEIVIDITATKEAEEELEQKVLERTADLEKQKALIQSIFNSSLNAIMAMEAVRDASGKVVDFTFVEINSQFENLIGLDKSVIGKSYLAYFPQSVEIGIFEMYCKVVETGTPQRKEFYSTNRGLNSWFEFSAGPRGQNGLVVNFANISPQREAAKKIEEQKNLLDSILKNSPVGITVYQAIRNEEGRIKDFRCILANDADERLTGIPAEDRRSKTFLDLIPNLRYSPVLQAAIAALEEGKPFRTEYFRPQNQKWLEFSVVRTYEEHFINVFRDITPVKDAQAQLEKNIEDLKRTNENLEEFAYAASHDLKEPVRKIHFFSDRLYHRLAGKLEQEEVHLFERMQVASKRMSTLIDDLLLYSQINRGAAIEESVNLEEKVKLVLEDLELEINEKKATIHVGQLPVIKGHKRQLQQLFQNLIANALKYCQSGVSPVVTLHSKFVQSNEAALLSKNIEAGKPYYLIEIKDNGIGFPQEDAERIFNVFTRLHVNTEYRGTGVGLSIVRKVVENHKGDVWAESEPGKGSTFKLLLPVE